MNKVELLAPAGDLNKLKTAIDYGADAVYLAGEKFGLRTASKNFTKEKLKEGITYAHDRYKKVYIAMNIIAHEEDLIEFQDYVQEIDSLKPDGFIVSDPGLVNLLKEISDTEVHISTQASVTNSQTINFWYDLGIRRIVLARELSFDEIRKIRKNIAADMELEMFVHGAMCISYSGRCLLSNYMVGRDANRGDCAHACRWKYNLVEEKRPNEYFPIEEDDQGAYILNSKDLCLIGHLDQVLGSGINSLKIEGRVKSEYYVATIVRAYRMALDAYYSGAYNEDLIQELIDEIRKASHRDFTTGFFLGEADHNSQIYESASYIRNYDFVGKVISYNKEKSLAKIEQRNKIILGDKIEVFGPGLRHFDYKIEKMYDKDMNIIEEAPHAQQIIYLPMIDVRQGYMLRKEI